MPLRFFIMLMLCVDIRHCAEMQQSSIRVEICVWESFKADCSEDEVIKIRSAFYGLMRSERCLNDNTSLIEYNCSTDVQLFVENRCKERSNCGIQLPDQPLDALSANYCTNSLPKYLEIVYDCHSEMSICPEFKPPKSARAENTSTGYRVICAEDDTNAWEVTCVQGKWTPQGPSGCRTRGANLVIVFSIIGLGVTIIVLITTVVIAIKYCIKYQTQELPQSIYCEVLPSGSHAAIYSELEELKIATVATLNRHTEDDLGHKVGTIGESDNIYSVIADTANAEMIELQKDASPLYANVIDRSATKHAL